MIDITLAEPTVAIVEERTDLNRAFAYQANMNQLLHAMAPGSIGGLGVPGYPTEIPFHGISESIERLYLVPTGLVRLERTWWTSDSDPMRTIEVITPTEDMSWTPSNLPPEQHPTSRVQRRPHVQHREDVQAFRDSIGMDYPNVAIALLNPLLVMSDYVCAPGTGQSTTHLGRATWTHRLDHHPERPINATDDPERLGSYHVEVAITNDDPPMLLEWSALHAGEPFSTTRVTWLRQGVDLDPAIFTDPRVPAPSLPFD